MTAGDLARFIDRMTGPLRRRVALMIGRGVVRLVDDTPKLQVLQVDALAGETLGGVEHFQPYGLTSHAHPGAECVLVSVGGSRDHAIVLVVDDRRYRIQSLAPGEVTIYDALGQRIDLQADGTIRILATTTIKIACDDVQIGDVGGGVMRRLIDERLIALFNNHRHGSQSAPIVYGPDQIHVEGGGSNPTTTHHTKAD